jgi:hypothetical protein
MDLRTCALFTAGRWCAAGAESAAATARAAEAEHHAEQHRKH